ncbi:MAG: LamG domain-containing protein, partial [Candidatus Brocadiia bacterium]
MRIETFKRGVFICLLTILAVVSRSQAKNTNLISYWNFDRVQDKKAMDSVSGKQDAISGHHRLVRGVKGQAIVMDGYTTCIARPSKKAPKLGQAFTIEAWVAIGAYPWNWAPIVAQENTETNNSKQDEICWPDDIKAESSKEGFFFGISPQGDLGLHLGTGEWPICLSENKVPLRKLTHVAATFDKKAGVVLYINGKKTAQKDIKGQWKHAETEELRIGMPRQKIESSHPVRGFATLASWYSFDGILDELRIYHETLSLKVLATNYKSSQPSAPADLPPRVMPSGPKGKGKFGASYIHLKYHPEWDAQWRLSDDPDIVVQFDDSPVRVVFWRGTRYGPAWVMENDIWMGDQSIENFNGKDGCIEHMLDPRCRFSHVRIVENTPARIVVHWRYLPTSASGNHSQVNPVSGWEDWVDEYYTFYPDQVGFRKVVLHSDGKALWPEEVIALCQPGQRPEDIIDLGAMTLANLNGKQHTYTWAE